MPFLLMWCRCLKFADTIPDDFDFLNSMTIHTFCLVHDNLFYKLSDNLCVKLLNAHIVVLSITIINCFRKNWRKKHRNSDWLGFPMFDSDWLNICLLFTLIDYDSMAMERSLRRRIFINYTITLAQTDIEVNIKSHIML